VESTFLVATARSMAGGKLDIAYNRFRLGISTS